MKLIKYFLLLFCLQNIVAQDYETSINKAFDKAGYFHFLQKDSAYFYYEKVIQLAEENNDVETQLYGLLNLLNVNGQFYDLNNYKKNIKREDTILQFDSRIDTLSTKQFFEDYLLFDKGNYHYKTQQYHISKKYFQQLQAKINTKPKNKQTIDDIDTLSSINSFLGLIYRHTSKYELAAYTYLKNIALLETHKDSLIGWKSSFYNSKKLLAQVHEINNDVEKANALLTEALDFYMLKVKDESYKNNFISTYMLLASNYIKLGNYTKAIAILDENSQFYATNNPFKKEIHKIYGDAYLSLHEFERAEFYYLKNLQETKTFIDQKNHPEIAKSYLNLGRLYAKESKFKKSLDHLQTALQQIDQNLSSEDLYQNPNPKKASSKLILLELLKEKLETLFDAYHNINDLAYLKNAHQVSKFIVQTLDELRPEFETKLDKQFLVTQTYPSLQKTVEVSHTLFQLTQDEKYIEDAFYFIEKSKSILLLEAQRNSEAITFGNVPATVIEQAHEFKTKIVGIEKEIFESKLEQGTLLDSLYSLKQAYTNWQLTVEKKYPRYYDLKYNSEVVNLKTIQNKLKNDQAVLNYMVVKDKIYVVLIDVEGYHLEQLPFSEESKNTVEQLYRKSSKLDINDTTLSSNSYQVYKTILQQILGHTKATDLTIIPDDILNYISFDALHSSELNDSYLIHSHEVSYANSATLWLANAQKSKIRDHKLLVFAPKFSQSEIEVSLARAKMSPLKYNQNEADQIGQFFISTIFKEQTATISNFKKQVSKHSILHFATHASANDEFPDYSYLAFSSTNSVSKKMYVKDIYSYSINADLVTLSACQTGFGKLQKGEGMLSMARAFQYAGASALVNTLWKVDDQSTSELMPFFYENLKNGLNKKEALRNAKLSYLENTDDPILKHPYYWSGIILSGNTEPIVTNSYMLWWGVLGIIFVLFLILIYTKRFSKNSQA